MNTRWPGICHGCGREAELDTRYDHGAKALCDDCAEKPHATPTATGLDPPPAVESAAPDRAGFVNAMLGLGMDPIVAVWRESAHLDAPISARLQSGRVLRWDRQRDLLKPDDLVAPILFAPGLAGPHKPLTKTQAMAIVNAVTELVETYEEHDHLAEAREWMDGFARDRPVWERDLGEADSFQSALLELHGFQATPDRDGRPPADWEVAPVVLDPATGRRFARTLDVADYVRQGRRMTISWPALNARLAEIGWKRLEKQLWTPRSAPREHARKVTVRVYGSRE
jgi:hypothetical protein